VTLNRETIQPSSLWNTKSFGFSHSILVEGKKTLYISGQAGINKDGQVIQEGFDAQCVVAFDSIAEILKEVNVTFRNVVKITGYVTDMANLMSFGKIASSYFKDDYLPAQTLVEVKGLALPGMLVEIEAIAVL
jgi:2-iminobutanoate/2-iminopropanoate deaminase